MELWHQSSLFEALEEGELIAGVDEAGRGPLCGSVFAAAVILDEAHPIAGLMDSKKLSEKRRFELAEMIKERAKAYAIASASVEEIEEINILQATLLAMKRAVEALPISPDFVRVDGNHLPSLKISAEAVVKGDQYHMEISAASILAKCARDEEMIALDKRYPQYGFAQHKGYGTAQHLSALQTFGVLPTHRRGFAPIRRLLADSLKDS